MPFLESVWALICSSGKSLPLLADFKGISENGVPPTRALSTGCLVAMNDLAELALAVATIPSRWALKQGRQYTGLP